MANIITGTNENFNEVINGELPVLVDFWATLRFLILNGTSLKNIRNYRVVIMLAVHLTRLIGKFLTVRATPRTL